MPSNPFDDKPIAKPVMSFEELLASKMNEEIAPPNSSSSHVSRPKKEFLKRNSKKVVSRPPTQAKKYNYYINHFSDELQEGPAPKKRS